MKHLIFYLGIIHCLSNCSSSNSKETLPQRIVNNKIEKALGKKWQLDQISVNFVQEIDFILEPYSEIIGYEDSLSPITTIWLKPSGAFLINDKKAGKWFTHDSELSLVGSNKENCPLDLSSEYCIDIVTDWELKLTYWFYDQKGNIKLRFEYIFYDYEQLLENRNIDSDIVI